MGPIFWWVIRESVLLRLMRWCPPVDVGNVCSASMWRRPSGSAILLEGLLSGVCAMERRRFGNSELEVSAISMGCWIVGVDWWGHYTDERGIELFQYAYDQGITFFDNGDAYGNGRAETVFAKFLKEERIPRDKVEIGSKFGYDFYSDPGEAGSHKERKQDFSPKFLRHALEQSLK